MGVFGKTFNNTGVQLGSLLSFIWNWGFWSRETETDYYASLEDGEAYISLTQKEQ